MNIQKIFYVMLVALVYAFVTSCQKEDFILDNTNTSSSSEECVKQASFQSTQWVLQSNEIILRRTLKLQKQNSANNSEKLFLNFKLSWPQPDTIRCQSCAINNYVVSHENRVPIKRETKYNLKIEYYQYNQNYKFDKIDLDFSIADEQVFYQNSEQQLPDFQFKTLKLLNKEKIFEYEFVQDKKKIHRYKCIFTFKLILKSTYSDEILQKTIIRNAWLDIIQ